MDNKNSGTRNRNKLLNQVNKQLHDIEKYSQNGITAEARRDIKRDHLLRHEGNNPKLALSEPSEIVLHTTLIMCGLGVIFLNYLLITAPIDFLASEAGFVKGSWQRGVASIFVPLFLLILEIGTAIAKRNSNRREIKLSICKKEVKLTVWDILGVVMILLTPLLICASIFAKINSKRTINPLLSSAMIIFALMTDAFIILSGEQIADAEAFIVFHCTRASLLKQIDRLSLKFSRSATSAKSAYVKYTQARDEHNTNFPDRKLAGGPFLSSTTEFLNKIFGYEVIILLKENTTPTHNTTEHSKPTSPNRSGEQVNPDTEAEHNYYRDLLNNQIRNNDREVRPED